MLAYIIFVALLKLKLLFDFNKWQFRNQVCNFDGGVGCELVVLVESVLQLSILYIEFSQT